MQLDNKNGQQLYQFQGIDKRLLERQQKMEDYFCQQLIKKAKNISYVCDNINFLKIILAQDELDFEKLKDLYDKLFNNINFDLDFKFQRQIKEMSNQDFLKESRRGYSLYSLVQLFLNIFIDKLLKQYLLQKKLDYQYEDFEYLKSNIQIQIVLEKTSDFKVFKLFFDLFYFNRNYKNTKFLKENIDLDGTFNLENYDYQSKDNFRTQQINQISKKFPNTLSSAQDQSGLSVINHSILVNDINLLKNILKSENIKLVNNQTFSPLVTVYQLENLEIFEYVIENLKNINFSSIQDQQLLFNIVKHSKVDYFKKCLKVQFDVNMKDKSGKTLLHHACIQGDFEIVKLLIERDCDYTIKDKSNFTCVQYAEKNSFQDIVDYIYDFYDYSYSNEELYDEYDDYVC